MILASASPRRQEILTRAGFSLSIEPADIDERQLEGETPIALVRRLAREKAYAAQAMHGTLADGEPLLAADTIVWKDGVVFGKPCDERDAKHMLRVLSGATHHVSTGVCILRDDEMRSFVETTDVTFRELTDDEICAYVASGEPADKAGAYAIQGGAARFVSHFEGDYDNVVGLPLKRVLQTLQELESAS